MEKRTPRCHNCIHSSSPYKLNNLTHVSCSNPKEFTQEKADNNEFSPWDQVRVFSDTCKDHEFKSENQPTVSK